MTITAGQVPCANFAQGYEAEVSKIVAAAPPLSAGQISALATLFSEEGNNDR